MPLDPYNDRMSDFGPVYAETDLSRSIVEPWNTGSAALFLFIVLYWLVRLRGRFRQHVFLTCCLPLLAAGGIGGTLYHATRASQVFFLLDVIPISLLGLMISLYLWMRLGPKWWHPVLVVVLYLMLNSFNRGLAPHLAITVSYSSLAILVLLPTAFTLIRTKFHGWIWVALALTAFGIALFCRFADVWRPPLLPMGTHWLWHLFGAATTAALAEYVFRIQQWSEPRVAVPASTN